MQKNIPFEKRHPWSTLETGIYREKPLAKCPVTACVRANKCLHPIQEKFCQRTHLTKDQWRIHVADILDKIVADFKRENPNHKPTQYDLDYGLRDFKLALEEICAKNAGVRQAKWEAMSPAQQTAERARIAESLIGRPRA